MLIIEKLLAFISNSSLLRFHKAEIHTPERTAETENIAKLWVPENTFFIQFTIHKTNSGDRPIRKFPYYILTKLSLGGVLGIQR